jgi:hypothetical protein
MTADEMVDALPEKRIDEILRAIVRSVDANGSPDRVPDILNDWSLLAGRRDRPCELQRRLDSANESNNELRKKVAGRDETIARLLDQRDEAVAQRGKAIGQLEAITEERNRIRSERDAYAEAALLALSGIVGTPEGGYVKDGGPDLFLSDAKQMRRQMEHLKGGIRGLLDRLDAWDEIDFVASLLGPTEAAAAFGEGCSREDGEPSQ